MTIIVTVPFKRDYVRLIRVIFLSLSVIHLLGDHQNRCVDAFRARTCRAGSGTSGLILTASRTQHGINFELGEIVWPTVKSFLNICHTWDPADCLVVRAIGKSRAFWILP